MERTYTIPLRKAFMKTPRYVRTNRAVREVRDYLQRHTKLQNVKLGEELNKVLWARGDAKPPARVKVLVKTEEEVAYAELVGKDFVKKNFSATEEKEDKKKEKKETRGVDEAVLKEAAGVKAKKEAKADDDAEKTAEKPAAAKKKAAK